MIVNFVQHDVTALAEPTNKQTKLSARLLLVLAGLVFGCIVSELMLRAIGYSYPLFYVTDYDRGYAPQRGQEGWSWLENKTYLRFSSEGFRDREHTKAKPAGTIRIAVLGDSYAEARQVPIEQTFWAVMEKQLQGCRAFAGSNVEVINFGVSGYGTAQELLTLRQRVWDYSPDVVLLTFTTQNDVIDNYRPLKQTEQIPYFVYQDGNLVYDSSFRSSPKYRWHDSRLFRLWGLVHDHSRLIQLIHHAQYSLRTNISDWRAKRRLSQRKQNQSAALASQEKKDAPVGEDVEVYNIVYREPADREWAEAWRVTEGLIGEIRNEVEQHGAKFMVVTISTDIQVFPDRAVREVFMRHIGVSNLFYPNLRLQAFVDREGIAFLDLSKPMQAYAEQNRVFLHGFGKDIGNGHWNVAGHQFAGQMMAQRLCEGTP